MPTSVVNELIKQVAELKTDMDWIKRALYLCIGASITSAISALPQLIKFLVQ